MQGALLPFAERYLLLLRNIRLSAGPLDEERVLNLRVSEWRDMHRFCSGPFGNRVLGFDIRWIYDEDHDG